MNAPTLEPDRTTIESYRGRATNVWQSGAAGIHIFNISNPRHPMFREIGDPQTLVGKDKVYFMTIRAARSGYGSPSFWVGNVGDIPRMPVLTPGEPGILHRDVPLELNLDVGEDLETARNMGLDPHVILQLVVSRLPSEQALDVHLNDHPLELINASYPTEAYRVETYQVDPTWLRPGSNLISVSLNNSGRSQFLYDLQLQIRY